MNNYQKIVRILPITFILMYAIGVFGMLSGVTSRNEELTEIAKLFTTYSLIPSFIVTVVFVFVPLKNKQLKLGLYVILFVLSALGLYFFVNNNNYVNLEMMQNFVLFPILFISVLSIVFFEIKYLKD